MAAPSLSKITTFPGESVKDDMTPTGTQWVHGGPLEKGVTNKTSVSIEDDVEQVQLQVLTSEPLADLQLKDTAGKEAATKVQSHKTEEGVFAGAHQYSLTVEKPKAGEWELSIDAKDDSAYLLVADFHTKADLLQGGTDHVDPGQQVSYQLNLNPKEVQSNSIKATYQITQSNNPTNSKTYHINGQTNVSQNFSVSEGGEVYNITIDIEGLTQSGKLFKRTVIDSVYVD